MAITIPSVCPHCGEVLIGEGLTEKLDGSGRNKCWGTRCLGCGSLVDAVEEDHECARASLGYESGASPD